MKKTLLLLSAILTVGVANAQQEIVAKELSKKEIKALKKQKKFEKQAAAYAKRGLNAYGINENAQSWFLAIKEHLPTARQQYGIPIVRPSQSLNTGRTFPLWVVNGNQMDYPPGEIQAFASRIREVRVLSSVAETNRFGTQGAAGVILLKIE